MVPREPARLSVTSIPLIDLLAQYRALRPEIDQALQTVLQSGQFILGPEVQAFEREAAAFCGTAHAVGVASGTDALELSLRGLGIGPGDEVITTAFSFFATAEAIIAAGAVPVFADIEPSTCNLDPAAVETRLTGNTKAIMPVHLYGHPCDLEPLQRFATSRGLILIEDCAQAMGASIGEKRVGSFGAAAALSFYPSKTLGAFGDGGMVITNDAKLADRVRLMRAHGSTEQYHHLTMGMNSRLDELQAAILRVKLRHLDEWSEARRGHAAAYAEAFQRAGLKQVRLPAERRGARHVYSLYTIRTPKRDQVQRALTGDKIAAQIAYPRTLPQQPALEAYAGSYPKAEAAAAEVLSLPMYPELSPEQIERVVDTVARALT